MEERSSQSTSAGPLTLLADAAVQVQVVRHDDGTDSTHQLDCGVVGAAKRKAAEEVAGTGRHEEKVHQVADHQPHCWVRLWTGHPSGIIELGICVHQPPTNLAMSAFKWQLPIAGAQKKKLLGAPLTHTFFRLTLPGRFVSSLRAPHGDQGEDEGLQKALPQVVDQQEGEGVHPSCQGPNLTGGPRKPTETWPARLKKSRPENNTEAPKKRLQPTRTKEAEVRKTESQTPTKKKKNGRRRGLGWHHPQMNL